MKPSKYTILYAYSSPTLHHGSPRVLVDIVSGLDNAKYHPILVCPQPGELTEYLYKHGTEVTVAKWRPISLKNILYFVKDILCLMNLFREKNIHILHVNQIGWRDSLVMAAWLSRIPIILHSHLNYTAPIRDNWNLRFATSIIVVADILKDTFKETPSVFKKLITVHNGLDHEKFAQGHNIRNDLGLPTNVKTVGFIGQIVEAKGLRNLILAAKTVLKSHPDTIFLFIGRCVPKEAGFIDDLMRMATSLNIAQSIRFLGPRDDIPDVLKSLDVLVLPTLREAFPKVILEGMGASVPVIASRVGGIPEMIDDGVNGLLVPPGDVQALEKALIRLLGDQELRKQLATEGLRTVRERFSVQTQVNKISAIYDQLLVEA